MTSAERKAALLARLKASLPLGSEKAIREVPGIRQVQVVPVEEVEREP